tara:strand:- start:2658 stop:3668 length:1011 start_codon:yes stop_codon:yes gene_type:complete
MINKLLPKSLKNILNKIRGKNVIAKLNAPTIKEKQLADELRFEVQSIDVIDTTGLTGPERHWSNQLNNLRNDILHKDPRGFLNWHMVKQTTFAVRQEFIKPELATLKNSRKFESIWANAILESNIGLPSKYPDYKSSSGLLIRHAYYIHKFEQATNTLIKDIDLVLDFGGGYGSMSRLFTNLGFTKPYIIFDFPIMCALQKYYLNSLGLNVIDSNRMTEVKQGIICISDFDILKKAVNHFNFQNQSNNLFMATWSISEAPIPIREKVLGLSDKFNSFLIGYKGEFAGVDNIEYFKKFQNSRSDISWFNELIPHMNTGPHYYLFGKSSLSKPGGLNN